MLLLRFLHMYIENLVTVMYLMALLSRLSISLHQQDKQNMTMTGICKVFIVIFGLVLTKMILPVINLALEIKSANRQRNMIHFKST